MYLLSFSCRHPVRSETFVIDAFFFHCILLVFVKIQVSIGGWFTPGFSIFPLINLSVFMSVPCGFYYYCSIVQLEIKGGDISRSFIVHDCCGNLGPFVSPYEAEYYSFKVCKDLCWNFYGNYADSVDYFW